MNGNTPFAGVPDAVDTDQPNLSAELTGDQKQQLRRAVASIVAQTREYLPEGYAIGSELSYDSNGPRATVAVHPPAGHAVSAGFNPDTDDLESGLDDEDRREVARGLAASAAMQVMAAVGDGMTPTAR